jgi:PAS domain-containing protein
LRSLPAFVERRDPGRADAVAAGGFMASGLLTLIVWLLTGDSARSLAIANEREVRVRQLMLQANDSILMVNRNREIVEANERATTQFGYSLAELKRMRLRDLEAPGPASRKWPARWTRLAWQDWKRVFAARTAPCFRAKSAHSGWPSFRGVSCSA